MSYTGEEIQKWLKRRFPGRTDIGKAKDEDALKEIISDLLLSKQLPKAEYAEMLETSIKAGRAQHRAYLKEILADDDADASVETPQDHKAQLAEMESKLRAKLTRQGIIKDDPMTSGNDLQKMIAGSSGFGISDGDYTTSGGDGVRVKGVASQYRQDRHILKHKSWGVPIHPIRNGSMSATPVESLSEWQLAKFGSFMKLKAARAGLAALNEHDNEVLAASFNEDEFIGWHGNQLVHRKNVKALLDDSTSGGENLVPNYVDRALVSFPLLTSELLPFVDIKDTDRGSSVETVSVGNPTVVWNTAEGTEHALFNTASLIVPITATVHPVAIFIEIGLDLLSDSVYNIGSQLMQNISMRMSAELDEVIANGDGATRPQGIMSASGTVDITPENPTTGAVTVNDLLDLMFGVAKQYRTPANNPRFVMTDGRYKSFRGLSTGVTGDTRLMFGHDVQSYSLLESPVAVENSGLTPAAGIFGALMKYRLWRRAGFELNWTREGATLARANAALLHGRGRFGGKILDGSAFAVCDGWPASA